MWMAITRGVSPAINQCELCELQRVPINVERACAQHRAYEAALRSLGVEVIALPAERAMPDSVFVEDTAVVLDECAVITRPGAVSRQAETAAVIGRLARHRELMYIQPPGTLDGGDVLCVGRQIYVGLSKRSNMAAIEQLRELLVDTHGYTVEAVPITGCLHLKTAVTQVADDTLLINPAWVDAGRFADMELVEVDPTEPFGANALMVSDAVLYQPAYRHTRHRLEQAGIRLVMVDASELAKAEGALTCCSLVFRV